MYGIIVLCTYALIMIGVTFIFTKKETNRVEFMVGNRKMGTFRSAMSIAATWIWAPALFVSAEKAYTNGVPGLFWFLVPNIICLIIFIPFAKKIRNIMPNGVTLSGFMGKRYESNKVKGIYLIQLTGLSILSTGVQLLAGSKILSSITGIPFWIMTIILGLIALSYSAFSGIKASVLTDTIQMLLILACCAIFIPWALGSNDGLKNLVSGLSGYTGEYGSLLSKKGIDVFLDFGLPTVIGLISGPFGDQCFWQRTFSIREDKIKKSFLLSAIIFGIVPISMGILGFIAAGSGLIPVDQSVVNYELIIQLFPRWIVIPFLFMVISGLLSTVDSNLCAVASLTTDVFKNKEKGLKIAKISMILLLLFGIGIANIHGLSVSHLFLIYGTLRATTLLPTVLTLLNKKLSKNGVFVGILTSFVVGLPIFAYGTLCNLTLYKTMGSLLTVLLSGLVAILVSRMEAKRVW